MRENGDVEEAECLRRELTRNADMERNEERFPVSFFCFTSSFHVDVSGASNGHQKFSSVVNSMYRNILSRQGTENTKNATTQFIITLTLLLLLLLLLLH